MEGRVERTRGRRGATKSRKRKREEEEEPAKVELRKIRKDSSEVLLAVRGDGQLLVLDRASRQEEE